MTSTTLVPSRSVNEEMTDGPEYKSAKRVQEKSQNLYYHQHIFRDYVDSYEVNPDLNVAWHIFKQQELVRDYNRIKLSSLIHDQGHISLSAELSIISDEVDYLMRDIHYSSQWLAKEYNEEDSNELFIHDSRRQGLTMNWKRARELYKKLNLE